MKQVNKSVLLLIMLSLACWGRLLFLEGIWGDDWIFIWQYLASDSYSQFIYPYQSIGHTLEGYMLYQSFNLFEYFKEDTTLIFNIIRFLLLTLNGLLIYFIFKNLTRHITILPEVIGAIYMVSPLVNILWICHINRTFFLSAILLSFLLTIKILKKERLNLFYYTLSVMLSSFAITGQESIIFIEIFRPFIIYYIISRENAIKFQNILKTIIYWSPYILIGTGILIYTLTRTQFGLHAEEYHPKGMLSLSGIMTICYNYFISIYYLFIGIYKHNLFLTFTKGDLLTYFLSFFALLLTNRIFRNFQDKDRDETFIETRLFMIFGLILIVAGIFPYAVARGAITNSSASRYALEANVGMAIFIPSTIFVLYYKNIISKKLCQVFITIIVLLGVGLCNTIVKIYDLDWQQQRSFWWQFVWRVPDLKEGTALLIDKDEKDNLHADHWATGPLNILYANSKGKKGFKNHVAMDIILKGDTKQRVIDQRYAQVAINGSFYGIYNYNPRNTVVASFYNGVLGINGEIDFPKTKEQAIITPFVNMSNPDRIIIDNNKSFPFRWVIGLEPDSVEQNIIIQKIREKLVTKDMIEKDWRYYYQNAIVASIRKDYSKVVKLYEDAKYLNNPIHNTLIIPEILVPFIEAFYITGDYTTGSSLLWEWAVYSNGNREKAVKMRDHIAANATSDCIKILDKDIKEIWQ